MVTYNFSTISGEIPVSDEWECANFYGPPLYDVLSFPETTISRGTPWISTSGITNTLRIYSNDEVASSFRFELPFNQQFTFEIEFSPTTIPYDLLQLGKSHLFIGVYDRQDNAAGLLISKMGLAIVATFGNAVLPIPGSHTIFEEGVSFVMRMVVDGVNDTLDLYITRSNELATTGHQLRYTAPAPTSPSDALDSIYINVMGTAAAPVDITISALRAACSHLRIPNKRPIADPGPDQTCNLGSVVRYDGAASYDPEGEDITYLWSLINVPDGSRFCTFGEDGYGYDDGGPDPWTNIFCGGPNAFSAANSPSLQPGDSLLFEGNVYTVSTLGWTLPVGGTWYVRDTGGTWPGDDRFYITEDSLTREGTPGAWKVCHSSSYFSDRRYMLPTAAPDIPGLYEVKLVVNDGQLDSLPAEGMLNVSSVRLVLGCIPDLSWIWNYLSDFWRLVDGREIASTVWSGIAQAAAAQLLTAWQIDYNKSLIDIQRKFQRRWLDYDTVLDDDGPTAATISIVRGPISTIDLSGIASTLSVLNGKVLQLVLDASAVQEITFSGLVDGSSTLQSVADQINAGLGMSLSTTKVASVVTEGPYSYILLTHSTLLMVRPNSESESANDILFGPFTAYKQNDLAGSGYVPYVSGFAVVALDGFVNDEPPLDFTTQGITDKSLLVVEGATYRVKKVATTSQLTLQDSFPEGTTPIESRLWLIPSVVESTVLNFEDELVVPGDIARFQIKHKVTAERREIYCEIVGSRMMKIGFNPRPLLEAFAGQPSQYDVEFLGIKHVKHIPVHEYVLDIPRLQEVINEPLEVLTQNLEFYIDDSLGSNAIHFKVGLFSLADPPPDTLWAEVTYLDNRPTIEANFGRLVNFKVEDLEERADHLDYLSAVQGLWWAYFGGPSLYRVRVGSQILLGLPFAEVEGTITEIETQFSATEGRILIQDKSDAAITRSYFYPLLAGLGTMPGTDETLKVGDEVEAFTPLSGGIEVKDYESDPDWFVSFGSSSGVFELDKFFKWMVRLNVDTFDITNVSFALDFIRRIRPHYTDPMVVLLKTLDVLEVNVEDTPRMTVRMRIKDQTNPEQQGGAYYHDDMLFTGACRHHYDATTGPDKFLYDRFILTPTISCWVVLMLYKDGVSPWKFDELWAYDDGGGTDFLALCGPTVTRPPPYGAPYGIVSHDEVPPAGWYARSKNL